MITKILLLLILGIGLAGCSLFPGANSSGRLSSNRSRITTPPSNPADMLQMVQANTRFGVDLYQALRK